jgi:predicted phosphodiesterase
MSGFIPASGIAATRRATTTGEKFMNFNYKPNGKFKILQLTDTHYIAGDSRSERAMKNVCEMLDAEKPDLVIHTGDIIFGTPAEECVRQILAPISERKIPFAVALGNHDSDFDLTRKEIFDVIKSIPYNINSTVTGLHGVSNDIITLSKENEDKPQWVFYLFDSNSLCGLPGEIEKGWGYIHFPEINCIVNTVWLLQSRMVESLFHHYRSSTYLCQNLYMHLDSITIAYLKVTLEKSHVPHLLILVCL